MQNLTRCTDLSPPANISHWGQTNLLLFADNSLLFLSSLRQCLNLSVRRDHFISIFSHCS